MTLLPEEIEAKRFLVALRGYDKEQVHAFLALVAEEQRALLEAPAGGRVRSEKDPAKALGDRVASIVRAALASAEKIRSAAEEEVSKLRAELDEDRARARVERDAASAELADAQYLHQKAEEIYRIAVEEASRLMATAQQELEAAIELRDGEAPVGQENSAAYGEAVPPY